MPFPDPTLRLLILVIIASVIVPLSLKIIRSLNDSEADERSSEHKENSSIHESYDPFADDPTNQTFESPAEQVKIKAKFIEIGSGTEEKTFGWIITPVE